jgi:predicted negative regulator of RcsB-dependent stress response
VQSFATSREKLTQAVALLDGVASRYGSLPAGKQAAYLAATCRLEMGELDAARKALTTIAAERGEKLLSAQARLSLAEVEARSGQVDKAAQALHELADESEPAVPRDYALLRLGLLLEQAHRSAEAAETFRRLARDFPTSDYVAEAQRRADYLQPQGRS